MRKYSLLNSWSHQNSQVHVTWGVVITREWCRQRDYPWRHFGYLIGPFGWGRRSFLPFLACTCIYSLMHAYKRWKVSTVFILHPGQSPYLCFLEISLVYWKSFVCFCLFVFFPSYLIFNTLLCIYNTRFIFFGIFSTILSDFEIFFLIPYNKIFERSLQI